MYLHLHIHKAMAPDVRKQLKALVAVRGTDAAATGGEGPADPDSNENPSEFIIAPAVNSFGAEFHQLLYYRIHGRPCEDVHSAGAGNGFETYPVLKNTSPGLLARSARFLRQVVSTKSASCVGDVENLFRHPEDLAHRSEGMAGFSLLHVAALAR